MTTTERVELSVVLPAYNEAGSIGRVVEEMTGYLGNADLSHEIHVVDDGSDDRTISVLQSLRARVPALCVLRHRRNLGYGAALRTGLAAARGDYVLLADGDGQFGVNGLEQMWRRRHEADLVLGYRNPRRDPRVRRAAGWLYGRVIVPLVFGGSFRDVNCGFKLLRRRVVEQMELRSHGALFSAELLTRARLAGATWIEVGVDHFPRTRGAATGLLPRVVIGMIGELVRHRSAILRSGRARANGLRTGCDAVESASA